MPDGSRLSGPIVDDRESGIFRVHRSAFVSDEILAMERSPIFDKNWLFAGRVTELPGQATSSPARLADARSFSLTAMTGGIATTIAWPSEPARRDKRAADRQDRGTGGARGTSKDAR
jgi:hypothetical protein